MTLADIKCGETCQIIGYALGTSSYRAKLLALGLVKNTEVEVIAESVLGDLIEILVRGYHLSLRRDEAKAIKVKKTS